MSMCSTSRVRRLPRVAVLVLLLGSWLLATLCFGQSSAGDPFDRVERQKLASGQLVMRASTEERGDLRLMGGSSWQIIDAPPAAVYQALLDTRHYTRTMPAVSAAKVISQQPGSRIVRMEHKRGPLGISYNLRARMDPEKRDITFLLEDAPSGAPRAAWGFFSVRPYGEQKTLLSYGVMADPGQGIIIGMLRSLVHEWMLRVPTQVKQFVESKEGRALYSSQH